MSHNTYIGRMISQKAETCRFIQHLKILVVSIISYVTINLKAQ